MNSVILALRTDAPEATILLFDSPAGEENSKPIREIDRLSWPAGRQLSTQLLAEIKKLLQKNQLSWNNLGGVLVFDGPGSFTGLRIGISVANTLAYSLGCPVVGSGGEDWIERGFQTLKTSRPGQIVLPRYGSEPNISRPKK